MQSDFNYHNMKDDSEKIVQSPEQIADHLRVTYVPTYLLAAGLLFRRDLSRTGHHRHHAAQQWYRALHAGA